MIDVDAEVSRLLDLELSDFYELNEHESVKVRRFDSDLVATYRNSVDGKGSPHNETVHLPLARKHTRKDITFAARRLACVVDHGRNSDSGCGAKYD